MKKLEYETEKLIINISKEEKTKLKYKALQEKTTVSDILRNYITNHIVANIKTPA